MADQTSTPLQFFARLLNGKSLTLTFPSPLAYGNEIKQRIFEHTKIPTHLQRLISGGHQISDESAVSEPGSTLNLVLSLRGGKGGFGSLLRGAATKAGQKKTNNFDACRDMSGRRLRHVNAEKRLQEWRDGEEERNLEKIAHEFLRKQEKKVKQGVGNGATHKYVKMYREESDRCIEAVDLALQESFQNGKRKAKMMAVSGSDKTKRLKIWKGKGVAEDSDSDNDSDEEDDDEKSVVLNNCSSQVDESSGSGLGLVMAGADSSGGSEEEKDVIVQQSSDALKGEIKELQVSEDEKMEVSSVAIVGVSEMEDKSSGDAEKIVVEVAVEKHGNDSEVKLGEAEPAADAGCDKSVEPLNFDDFNSATDMEVMGMERLKSELQSCGLKCGGTLQERAARLFLLKSTPLDKLPKKLLAMAKK